MKIFLTSILLISFIVSLYAYSGIDNESITSCTNYNLSFPVKCKLMFTSTLTIKTLATNSTVISGELTCNSTSFYFNGIICRTYDKNELNEIYRNIIDFYKMINVN